MREKLWEARGHETDISAQGSSTVHFLPQRGGIDMLAATERRHRHAREEA